jgi:hypothetical protein
MAEIDIKQLERTLQKINTKNAVRGYLSNRHNFTEVELQNLYNAWNSLDPEHDKIELEKHIPEEYEKPTKVLLSPVSTLYKEIETKQDQQKNFAFNYLIKLMKLTEFQPGFLKTIRQKVEPVVAAEEVGALISLTSVYEIRDAGGLLIEETTGLLRIPLDIQPDSNFLKINAEIITKFIILIINYMLLIFCCMLTLSRLLSREDVQSSPEVKQKIFLLKKALMQYYTNFFRLIASVLGFPNFVRGAKKLSWSETSVIIAIFIGIRIVLSYIDPNNYVMNVVMFPISFPIYCTDLALSKVGINLTNMFWSRIDLIMDKIQSVGDEIIGKALHLMLSWVKDNVIGNLKDDIIKWFSTDGAQRVQDAVQGAVQDAVQDAVQGAVPQIQDAVQNAVQSEFQVAIPRMQGAIQEVAQSNLLDLQALIEQSSASCPLLTQHQADMLSRISDDPTTLEQFTKSLSWWSGVVQENAIKVIVRGFLEVRGNPRIGYHAGRKTRKYRKNYKNKTKIYRKKQTHKLYRRKGKKGKKTKKY